MIELYDRRIPVREIAAYFQVSTQRIYQILESRGIKRAKIVFEPSLEEVLEQRRREGRTTERGIALRALRESHLNRVHRLVLAAVRSGILTPKPCEVCGFSGTITSYSGKVRNAVEAHHADYNKPLEVRWLCRKHHMEWHSKNKPKPVHGVEGWE